MDAQELLKLERYIPLLENLVDCVESVKISKPAVIQWTADLKFRWTSPLSRSGVTGLAGPKFFRVDDLRYELCMILFLYAALLRERALEVLPTGRNFDLTCTDQRYRVETIDPLELRS